MAVATAPSLGGTTLAPPKEQNFNRLYRGGTLSMANGAIVHDLVDLTPRHAFKLRWEFISAAQFNTIVGAWDAIKNATATYVTVTGSSYVVTQPENAQLDITLVTIAGGQIAYHVAMDLVETP